MKKVFVGISGGVDSSVSAYLLKEQGYDVTGVFIKVWYPDFVPCNWRNEMHDAMRVCAKLGIPFLLCDLESEYKSGVIDYMISEYKIGRTPNPDVMCNKEIKFKAFLNFAINNGADFIATGHYAKNIETSNGFELYKSKDKEKDQTYFIWNLNQEILKRTLFPIGDMKKSEVRKIAKRAGLFTATKKDSQGLCFIGTISIKDFLKEYINTKPGDVLDNEGNVIGRHDGAILYTIGERHNFEILHKDIKEKPLYITEKDIEKNTITVSESKKTSLLGDIALEKVNFINTTPELGKSVFAKTRYRQEDHPCIIKKINDDKAKIKFESNQDLIARGQSVVLYDGEKCLGGGIIS